MTHGDNGYWRRPHRPVESKSKRPIRRYWTARPASCFGFLGVVLIGFLTLGCTATTVVEDAQEAPPPTVATALPNLPAPPAVTPTSPPDPPASTAAPVVEEDAGTADEAGQEEDSQSPNQLPSVQSGRLLGISSDGGFAYVGTKDAWSEVPACDDDPTESLVAINVIASAEDNKLAMAVADFAVAGAIRQMAFNDDGTAAVVWSCGPEEERRYFLQHGSLGGQGAIVAPTTPVELVVPEGELPPALLHFVSSESVLFSVGLDPLPDDPFLSRRFERREISVLTGETLASESFLESQDEPVPGPAFVSPDGRYSYRAIDDPAGNVGCEGSFTSRTLEVSDESGARLALGPDGVLMASISDVQFGPDGLIAWSNGCVANTNPVVGRIQDDGTIVDGHYLGEIAPIGAEEPATARYRFFGISDDGHLIGLGSGSGGTDVDIDSGHVRVFRYNLALDPGFVESADPQPQVDRDNPLGTALDGTSTWFVGEASDTGPTCGSGSLYAETSTGLTWALEPGSGIDPIVDIEVSESRVVTSFADDFERRVVVFETECPEQYEGRRVWFDMGERERVRDGGLNPSSSTLVEVADVLAVYEIVAPGDNLAQSIVVEVERLDGTIEEVELLRAS